MSNDLVLEGKEGFLFLSGGRHSPLRFAQAGATVIPDSINQFWANIQRRQAQMKKRGINYAHLIAPDKHSVCKDVFPVDILISLGDQYIDACPNSELLDFVCYPRQELSDDFRRYCYRVDTHYRPSGTWLMLKRVLDKAVGAEANQVLENEANLTLKSQDDWSGDLGSKLSPPQTESKEQITIPKTVRRYSNNLAGGNNGIIDLYFNLEQIKGSENRPGLGRVLVIGDSYGRDIARTLSMMSSEVLFIRTPYMHIEVVDAMKPDLVISENAERYLSAVGSDEDRPVFFLFPFLKDNDYSMAPEMAKALSAVLSYGRQPYTSLIATLVQESA
jgi:hypothetical protein